MAALLSNHKIVVGYSGELVIDLHDVEYDAYEVSYCANRELMWGYRLFRVHISTGHNTVQNGIVKSYPDTSVTIGLHSSPSPLHATKGKAMISGFELIAEGLPDEPVIKLKPRVVK